MTTAASLDLTRFLAPWRSAWPQRYLDLGEVLEHALVSTDRDRAYAARIVEDIDHLLSNNDDLELWQALDGVVVIWQGDDADEDEGHDLRLWLSRVASRITDGPPADADVIREVEQRAPERGFIYDRMPGYPDDRTGEEAANAVVNAHSDAVQSWIASKSQGRLYLTKDLRRPVGTLKLARTGEEVATSVATITIARVPHRDGRQFTTRPEIIDTHPELDLDPVWAQRYPWLSQLFGGWFGPTWTQPWNVQVHYLSSTPQPQMSLINDELKRLLSHVTDADELREAVRALGSFLVPQATRQWLERLVERTDRWLAGDRSP